MTRKTHTYGRKTLRRMPSSTRKLAEEVNRLEASARRLRKVIETLEADEVELNARREFDANVAKAQKFPATKDEKAAWMHDLWCDREGCTYATCETYGKIYGDKTAAEVNEEVVHIFKVNAAEAAAARLE